MTKYAALEAARVARGGWTPGIPTETRASRTVVRTYQDTKWAVVLMADDGKSFEVVQDRLSYEDADRIAYRLGGNHRAQRLRTKQTARMIGFIP